MAKRVAFMGTPEFAKVILEALMTAEIDLVAVVTQPDKPFGRHQELRASAVKVCAQKHQIPVYQPAKVGELSSTLQALKLDLIVTCAYGQLIPMQILNLPTHGSVNVHASLLPKYRGGAPIHWALINGEKESGITLMRMVKQMDAGDILAQAKIPINDNDDVGSLHDKLASLGAKLLLENLETLFQDRCTPIAQDPQQVSFAYTIQKVDEHIDFHQSAQAVYNRIRGLHPWPVGHVWLKDKRVKIFRAKIGPKTTQGQIGQIMGLIDEGIAVQAQDGLVLLYEVQLEGKKRLDARTFYTGLADQLKAFT